MTTFLEILGVACLVAFAFFIWPPAALGAVGVAALIGSYSIEARRGGDGR